MALRRTLFAALATAPLSAGHPAPASEFESSGNGPHGEIGVLDSTVDSAVYLPEADVWDQTDAVITSTQTAPALPYISSEPTITTTLTLFSTETVTLPAPTHTTPATADGGNLADQFGVSYASYRANHQCKAQADIDDDMEQIAGKYSLIRVYGTDCDQVPMLYKAAKAKGMKLFLGIWDPSAVANEASKIIAGVNGDWDMVHTVSVGNELVNNGQASPAEIVNAVNSARSILRAAGYQGPVVSVDSFIAIQTHPELCEASDYCAMNAHPFFDSTTTASQAGPWLVDTIQQVKSALKTQKKIVVTETGWPTQGFANGLAVPGLANQKMALDSIQAAFATTPGDIILLSAFNDLWKPKVAATFNADQFWGINGAIAKCDL